MIIAYYYLLADILEDDDAVCYSEDSKLITSILEMRDNFENLFYRMGQSAADDEIDRLIALLNKQVQNLHNACYPNSLSVRLYALLRDIMADDEFCKQLHALSRFISSAQDSAAGISAIRLMLKSELRRGNIPNSQSLVQFREDVKLLHKIRTHPNTVKFLQTKMMTEAEFIHYFSTKRLDFETTRFISTGTAADSLVGFVNYMGLDFARKLFITLLENKKINLSFILNIFALAEKLFGGVAKESSPETEDFICIIQNATVNGDTWGAFKERFDRALLEAFYKKFPEKDIQTVYNEFTTKSVDVQFPMSKEEMTKLVEQYSIIKKLEIELSVLSEAKLEEFHAKVCKKLPKIFLEANTEKYHLLAVIRERIKRCFGVFPYNVQMLNILAFLNNPNGRRVAQIKTGEGKSITIAMLAAFLAHYMRVDICTTSKELAERDCEKFKAFYSSFKFTVDTPCHEDDQDLKAAFASNIMYGPVEQFEFAYLYDMLAIDDNRGNRKFSVMIIDEADSMFIDTQSTPARIASPNGQYSPVLYTTIWEAMTESEAHPSASALQAIIKDKIRKEYPLEQVETWISSASQAQDYELGKDYTISKGKIVIVDYRNTGQLVHGSRWHKGIHSFLEVKHGLKVRPEDGTCLQVTHYQYFNMYRYLFGLTGTLGNEPERDLLKMFYNIDLVDSPPYHPSIKKPEEHLIVLKDQVSETLKKDVTEKVSQGRPVLIICETINASKELYKLLKGVSQCVQLYNAEQKESVEQILSLAALPRTVTIATNTAGRGTDITISHESARNGGLHVIVTFYTINVRVELQAFGRTGRQGRPGTYRYILPFEGSLYEILSQKGEKALFKFSFQNWLNRREEINKQTMRNNILTKELYQKLFVFQKALLAEIPRETRNIIRSIWTQHYSILLENLDKVNREMIKYDGGRTKVLSSVEAIIQNFSAAINMTIAKMITDLFKAAQFYFVSMHDKKSQDVIRTANKLKKEIESQFFGSPSFLDADEFIERLSTQKDFRKIQDLIENEDLRSEYESIYESIMKNEDPLENEGALKNVLGNVYTLEKEDTEKTIRKPRPSAKEQDPKFKINKLSKPVYFAIATNNCELTELLLEQDPSVLENKEKDTETAVVSKLAEATENPKMQDILEKAFKTQALLKQLLLAAQAEISETDVLYGSKSGNNFLILKHVYDYCNPDYKPEPRVQIPQFAWVTSALPMLPGNRDTVLTDAGESLDPQSAADLESDSGSQVIKRPFL